MRLQAEAEAAAVKLRAEAEAARLRLESEGNAAALGAAPHASTLWCNSSSEAWLVILACSL